MKYKTFFFLFLACCSHAVCFEYKNYTFEHHSVHVITADLDQYELKLINAGGDQFCIRDVKDIAKENHALVAVNGGFFLGKPNEGNPAGVFYSRTLNILKSSRVLRGAVGWKDDFLFGRVTEPAGEWLLCDYIIGGAPLLLVDGEIQDFSIEKTRKIFLTFPHARTALGINNNNELVLAKAEGHRLGHIGFPMDQWAAFLKEIGIVHGLNLDGGSASSIYIDKQYVTRANRPSSDALTLVVEMINSFSQKEESPSTLFLDDTLVEKEARPSLFLDHIYITEANIAVGNALILVKKKVNEL